MPYHIRNILIAVLIVLLAIVAAVDAYINYQLKSNLDNAIESAKAFITIKYKDLSTSPLSGKVELSNVRLSAPFIPEPLLLGDISLETTDFSLMLNGASQLKKGDFPDQLALSIDNASFDIQGENAEFLDNFIKRLQPLYAGTNAKGVSERKICGGKSLFGPSEYKEFGYSRLISNLHLSYDFDNDNNQLTIRVKGGTQNLAKFNIQFSLSGVTSLSNNGIPSNNKVKLDHAQLAYEDETYIPRVVKYCAELDKTTKEDFINAEVNESERYFYKLWGFSPGPGLREAYKDFLLRPEQITISMQPDKKFQLAAIAKMTANEIVEALNAKLKINGLQVTDLSFKLPPASFTEDFDQQLARAMNIEALMRGEKVKPPEPVKKPVILDVPHPKYHKITIKEAAKHVGDYVKITTLSGKEREGRLIKLDDVHLFVRQKVSGGNFTMNIPRSTIKEIEAYFDK